MTKPALTMDGGSLRYFTADDYFGPNNAGGQVNLKQRLAGTDKWNSVIWKVAQEEGVNPLFLKITMAIESSGNKNIKDSYAGAMGIMQIMPSWGYDPHRLRTDVEYSLRAASAIMKSKHAMNKNVGAAQVRGGPGSVEFIARAYNGWGSAGKKYQDQFSLMYEGFGFKRSDSAFTTTPTPGSTSPMQNSTGAWNAGMVEAMESMYQGPVLAERRGVASETYSGPSEPGMNGIVDKPNFVPPHYYEDDFKALPGRYIQNDYFMRIGDTRFVVPPTHIRISESTDVTSFDSIRQKQTMKVQSGHKMRIIETTLMFTDFDQINGYEVEGPDSKSGYHYHMDGLRSLLAQMKTMPFLPIENELLNTVYGIYAGALLNCSVNVVDGFPDMLQANLTILEFDPYPFLQKPAFMYDAHFIWPLFRWHYQRLLNGRTNMSDGLAPFIGDDIIQFSILDEEKLSDMQEAINDRTTVGENERYLSFWDLNDEIGHENKKNSWFVPYEMNHDYQIVSVQGTMGNNLVPLTPSLTGSPVFQYFGSQDTRFNIILQTGNREVIQAFTDIKNQVDYLGRTYRDRFVASMLRVENNFINMMGVSGVMIESMSVETVEGQPGEFYIAFSMVSFDETQSKDEQLGALDILDIDNVDNLAAEMQGGTLENYVNNIKHPVLAERMMDEMEMYPDLELPTYESANSAITRINDWRRKRNLSALPISEIPGPVGGKFVDPDFFFSYPHIDDLIDDINEKLKDPEVAKLAAEEGVDIEELGGQNLKLEDFLGQKISELILDENPDIDAIDAAGRQEKIGLGTGADMARMWDGARAYIRNRNSYTDRFWVKAWSGAGGDWVTADADVDDRDESGESSGKNWDFAYFSKETPELQVQDLTRTDRYYGMMHDMIMYDRSGTMMRAFPTYCLVLIDEGRVVNVRKLWDNYYTYHSVSEINVHMDRKNPIHTAYIRLSNIYGSLTIKEQFATQKKDASWKKLFTDLKEVFVNNVTERELEERKLMFKSIELLAGARIHLRMGYGSAASQLPPVFNGVISEMETGDVVTIVAQSFGHELTGMIGAEPGEKTAWHRQGLEPTQVFRYYLTERNSNYTWAWRNSGEAENYQSAYGIEHFGFLRVRDKQDVTDISSYWWPFQSRDKRINAEDYDLMKNVYSTRGYEKLGTDEGNVEGRVTEDDYGSLSDVELSTNTGASMEKAINKEDFPTTYKWMNKVPTIVDPNELKNPDDIKKVTKRFKKNMDPKEKELLTHAVYWWFANPHTDNFYGPGLKFTLGYDAFLSQAPGQIEGYLEPIKEVDKDLYDEMLKEIEKIVDEYAKINAEGTMNGGAIGGALDRFGKWGADHIREILNWGQGEENIRMELTGKSPWDVFKTLEFAIPEYVVYPHIHQFGYTMFFGKPWWDVQCGYVLPRSSNESSTYGQKMEDYWELSKPFSQAHFYTADSDIISNNIKVDGSNLMTACIPVFNVGRAEESYDVIWSDYYIRGSHQKLQTVDTSLAQTTLFNIGALGKMTNWTQKNILPTVKNLIGDAVNLMTAGLVGSDGYSSSDEGGELPKYEKHAARFAQSAIQHSYRDMYQGELIVFGDPSAKPYDFMYIDDMYMRMTGNAEAGTVVHQMGLETGFITSIKPDMSVVVNPDIERDSEDWVSAPEATSEGFMANTYMGLMGVTKAWVAYSSFRLATHLYRNKYLARQANLLLKGGKAAGRLGSGGAAATAKIVKRVPVKWAAGSKAISLVKLKGGQLATKGRTAVNVVKGTKIAQRIATRGATAAAATAAVPGPGWVTTAVLAASTVLSVVALNAVSKIFVQKHNNTIKLFPLFMNGKPFVGGVNGHKQLIPGWEDSGSGIPISVEYGNVEKLDPLRAKDVTGASSAVAGSASGAIASGEAGDYSGNASPAKWLGTISRSALKPGLFSAPVTISGNASFSALRKRVSSHYANYRKLTNAPHRGTDFNRRSGKDSKLLAFADGVVIWQGKYGGAGNHILIQHVLPREGGSHYVFYTSYSHIAPNGYKTKVGQRVRAGQDIAVMGTTGTSTGEHLHFEVLIPKDMNKAKNTQPGEEGKRYVYGGYDSKNRLYANMNYVDPMVFMEEIVAYDSSLLHYPKS